MSEQNRAFLKPVFRDSARPSGKDFADLIDSFVNKADDGLTVTDGDLVLAHGVRLGNSTGTVAGGLRFSGGQVQFHDGTNWVNVGAGVGGAFPAVGTAGAVAHSAGNVGIGPFSSAPTFKLDVTLAANSGPGERVRLGNAVVSNGAPGTFAGAMQIAHQTHASDSSFALRQLGNGQVHLNAPVGQSVTIRHGGDANIRFGVAPSGNVIVGAGNDLTGSGGALLQVNGEAFKNTGTNVWTITSDARLKEDVRDLELGLSELRRLRPVRFRYNGRAGTTAGLPGVGVLGQEIEAVIPETVRQVASRTPGEEDLPDMRIFDGSALTYVLINAVKELAAKVEQLERALADRVAPAAAI